MNPYIALAQLMLPHEISESFELVKVKEKKEGFHSVLHLYLDEKETPPDHRSDLRPNGFYSEALMGNFPVRDREVCFMYAAAGGLTSTEEVYPRTGG